MPKTVALIAAVALVLAFPACGGSVENVLEIDTESIDRIAIERFEDRLVLEKKGEEWFVTVPVETKANPVTVDNLLVTLDKLSIEERVSKSSSDHSLYGVDENAPVITLQTSDDVTQIVVGRAGRDFETQHLRIDEDETVYLARGRLNTTLRVDVWRDRIIVDIDPAEIQSATFTTPDGTSRLEMRGDQWILTDSAGEHEITNERVEQWARFFNPLRTDRFAQIPKDIVSSSGQRAITLFLDNGTEKELHFLDVEGEFAVAVNGKESVYQIFGLRLNNLFPDLLSFY